MDNRSLLSPHCVPANYTAQRIPQFSGNPLIEALPPSMSDEEAVAALTLMPAFAAPQRAWATHDRLHMLESLQNFMVPLSKHLELARALDSLLRAGYVGRAPRTAEHARIYQDIYEKQKAGISFRQEADSRTPQLSASLIGLSGMGKTTTVARWLAHVPKVIYHRELNVYQVPYLHVEMPSNGSSIKGLAHGILQQLDSLIPGANYYYEHAVRGKPGADALMWSVARIMNMHFVGLLIGDEVQNLANAHKGDQTVMTELVSACNTLRVPLLFIGTNKSTKVLGLDFRQSRRSSGHGIAHWGRLPNRVTDGEVDEWAEFLGVLWAYQWVRNPVALDGHLLQLMYDYSQGVIDIAIKLFASCQARAMLDGSETITSGLMHIVYQNHFKLLHPMLDALRNDDLEALARYDDVAPIELGSILESVKHKLLSKASPLYKVKAGDPTYVPRIVGSLVSAGFGAEEAQAAAEATATADNAPNVLQGVKAALRELTVPKQVPRTKPSKGDNAPLQNFDDRPGDYRRAIQEARMNGSSILAELARLGMTRPLDEVLDLN